MTNMAIFVGTADIRAEIPTRYLAVPGIIAVGATGGGANRAGLECERCGHRWDAHSWLVYAGTGFPNLPVLDCSQIPRVGSGSSPA